MLTLGVVFNFHINPETPARKHAPASGGGAPQRLLVFGGVVGRCSERNCVSLCFDTTSLLFSENLFAPPPPPKKTSTTKKHEFFYIEQLKMKY